MVGPSKLLCRGRFQTALSCCGPRTAVVNVKEKARPMDRVMWGVGRRAQANLCLKHRNGISDDIETGIGLRFRDKSLAATYLLARRCPVQKRRDPTLGFRTELENLVGDAKGKGTSGSPVRTTSGSESGSGDSPGRLGLMLENLALSLRAFSIPASRTLSRVWGLASGRVLPVRSEFRLGLPCRREFARVAAQIFIGTLNSIVGIGALKPRLCSGDAAHQVWASR